MTRRLILLALMASLAVISFSVSEIVVIRFIERGHTEQTRIEWDARVQQTQIEWDARTDIAQIQADATRDTSAVYNTFSLLRCLLVAAGLLMVLVGCWLVVSSSGKGATR